MDARPVSSLDARLHRVYVEPVHDGDPALPRLRVKGQEALVLAMASAWVELAIVFGHRALVGTVTRVSYRQNWYAAAMSVPAHLAIFAAWFAVVALLWVRPRRRPWVDPASSTAAWFLAFVSPLLAVEELYWPCSLVLAAGLAWRVAPWWRARRAMLGRKLLPAMAIASTLLVAGGFAWTRTAESRSLAALPAAPAGAAPNVVMLVLDTVRADHLSLYGYARQTSPHLDALAGRSVVFDFARSPAPWTLPSHATMFTGRWPHQLSVDTDRPLSRDVPTIAGFLSEQGYATAGFTGNLFYTNAWFGLDRGFARYLDAPENQTISVQETLRSAALGRALMPAAVATKVVSSTGQFPARRRAEAIRKDALQWIDARDPSHPFFLFLNYFDAHDPYIVPPEFPVKYSWEDRVAVHQQNRKYNGHAAEDDARQDSRAPDDPELTRVMLDAYDDCLRYVDDQIARLLTELERRGLDQNTWVMITADHGEQFNDHGFTRHGATLYRCEVDVPLLIVPPRGADVPATRVTVPVSPRDLPATIADLAGLSAKSPFPGRSLRRYFGDASSFTEEDRPISELKIPANHLKTSPQSSIDHFRAALADPAHVYHRSPIDAEELYDATDRDESRNLVDQPGEGPALDKFRANVERLRKP